MLEGGGGGEDFGAEGGYCGNFVVRRALCETHVVGHASWVVGS
jgi:hypothetical protein